MWTGTRQSGISELSVSYDKNGYKEHLNGSDEFHKKAQSGKFEQFRPFWGLFWTYTSQDNIFSFLNLLFQILS